jgi:outer membrane lipoprotein SlyB
MKSMKLNRCILALGGMAVVLTGCQNPDGTQNNTGSGALIGGAMGALTGAAIGGRHHGGQDALIGAAAGVVAGGLIGYTMDREQESRLKAQAPQTLVRVDQGQPLTVADVKALAKAGITEDVIISQIGNSHTIFHLSSADIIDLRDSGVSDKVIQFMISTASMPVPVAAPQPAVVIEQAPPPPPVEVRVVAPGPDFVWIDGEWQWGGAQWVWVGGRWGAPPHLHAIWVGGRRWHDGRGWHEEHGHWR